ncbi:hypothetical protein ABZ281_40530 [Streptomyces sp. NPDC006265]|uniref:hypothetical protein n=1 Tax=Streptomyces sp. NPDC006265 TaxID=3156740 RepID=UPI0033AD8797
MTAALGQDPRRALPAVRRHGTDETWVPRRDLLDSGPSTSTSWANRRTTVV